MIKFNSLENKIISCGDDSLIKIWDIGKIKKCITLKGHTQSISAFKFAHHEEDNIIYSVSKDCTIKKWDLRVGSCVTSSPVQ
jgi:WD40 repeat protein